MSTHESKRSVTLAVSGEGRWRRAGQDQWLPSYQLVKRTAPSRGARLTLVGLITALLAASLFAAVVKAQIPMTGTAIPSLAIIDQYEPVSPIRAGVSSHFLHSRALCAGRVARSAALLFRGPGGEAASGCARRLKR
jgi:hypothetical protein